MIVPSSGPFGATFPPEGRLEKKAANPRLSPKISAARLKIPGMAENERKTSQKN